MKEPSKQIVQVSILVKDYDEAIEFYTRKLGFALLKDETLSENKRWVVVAPNNTNGCHLLLAKASNQRQTESIGNQTGGRVFLFLQTDDFWEDYRKMMDVKIKFKEEPREEPYGIVVVFEDLYGNLWDLVQPKR